MIPLTLPIPSYVTPLHSNSYRQPPPVSKNIQYNQRRHAFHRMREHSEKMVQEQIDIDRQEARPVVWKWVPSVSEPSSQPASTLNPRVIYAAATKIESNYPKNLPTLISGGELQSAGEAMSRHNVEPSVASASTPSTALLRIPAAPTSTPRHVDLERHPLTQNPHHKISGVHVAKGDDVAEAAVNNGTGELEVANLLLNMGGGPSANAGKSNNDKKQTSMVEKTTIQDPSSKSNKPQNKSISNTKPANLQDFYLENWVGGSVSLHTPEDDDVLSPLHCFMRRYCVEAFSATEEDVATPRYGKSHGFKVEIGQVGIRCLHCKDCSPGKRAERAVCYPSSLRNIYHSIETWQRRHSLVCKKISPWVRKSILELMESSKTRAGGRRQYWEDSAR